jgi:DNA-binding IclR family transcriptional regulator
MAGNSSERGRGVVSKAMALLDAYLPSATELSLNALAERSGLPLSTTYRLAGQLVEWGGLERVEGGGYRLGLRLWEIGSLAGTTRAPLKLIGPYIQDLSEAVRENVHLAVRDGSDVVFLEKLSGTRATPLPSRLGGRLPLHATAVGKSLIAYATPQERGHLLPAKLARYTSRTVTNRDQLETELAKVRQEGVSFASEELTVGVTAVGAPIRDAAESVIAAVSVVVSTPRLRQHHVAAVKVTSSMVSRHLRDLGVRVET